LAIISSTRDDWSRISRSKDSKSLSKCFDMGILTQMREKKSC
jgi:hypothetical protein